MGAIWVARALPGLRTTRCPDYPMRLPRAMEPLRRFFRHRVRLGGVALLLGCAVRLCEARPPAPSREGLAAFLGAQAGGVVAPDDLAWEPTGGELSDLFAGRWLLFLAAPAPGQPRDLYRARVQVTREGQPLRVLKLRNVSRSPLGDDAGLDVRGQRAVFATAAFGAVQAVTVLDLDGVRTQDRPQSALQRVLASLSSYQRTASFAGLGRTDVVFDAPTSRVTLAFQAPELRIGVDGERRDLAYDVEARLLVGPGGAEPYGARIIPRAQEDKPLVLWAVDTLRAEVGPGPVAWLERVVFGARDLLRRNAYSVMSTEPSDQLRTDAAPGGEAVAVEEGEALWPPPPLPSMWQALEPGEGTWEPVTYPFLASPVLAPPGDVTPYFYRSFIRPDARRPYVRLLLIAMDPRALELRVQAGYEDPEPSTGPPGTGRLPTDPSTLERVVATFNGAFKTDHGAYGMMVDRRVLLPAVPGGATVVIDERGGVGLGNWPQSPAPPPDIVSFRQNLDPLVEDGVVNPSGRYVWGWQLAGSTVMTQRTALCLTGAGNLLYAFGDELDADSLARGLRQAGCAYAIHLDMNAGHCGFVFTDVVDQAARRFSLQKASPEMQIPADKFVSASAKDFFYVLTRDPRPALPAGLVWRLDGGAQPAPRSLPALLRGTLDVGHLPVELTSFEGGRFAWRIRAGELEPHAADRVPLSKTLDEAEQKRALAALGLGHTTADQLLGISFHTQPSIRLRDDQATMVAGTDGRLSLYAPGEAVPLGPGVAAAQVPLLADEGELLAPAREPGSLRPRGALCVTDAGRVVVARVEHDSPAPAVAALIAAGCRRVVELERGSHHASFIHRAGSSTPPVGRYEVTVLYALEAEPTPRAYRWRPPGSKPSSSPSSPDVSRERALRAVSAPP